jgi:hypothetical protein
LAARQKIFADDNEVLGGGDIHRTQKESDTGRRSDSPGPATSQIRQPTGPTSENARGFGSQSQRRPGGHK